MLKPEEIIEGRFVNISGGDTDFANGGLFGEAREYLMEVFDLQLLYLESLCLRVVENETRRIGVGDAGSIEERDMRNGRGKLRSRRRDVRARGRRRQREV